MYLDDTRPGAPPGPRSGNAPREDELQRLLFAFNQRRLFPAIDGEDAPLPAREELALRDLETAFVDRERRTIADWAADAPEDADGFVVWFESLRETGPGQGDLLFPWLASEATLDQMRWFLAQEVAGEAGFDDLVALTQVKMPVRAKLEMGRNLWDELGRGMQSGMHGPMLADLARALDLRTMPPPASEALALANLMMALAANRRWAFHSVGALGAIELTAPGRAALVEQGLRRLGIRSGVRRYYALHATLDVQHAKTWVAEVLASLVAEDGRRARAIAEGALLRLQAGARCFDRYRAELGVASA